MSRSFDKKPRGMAGQVSKAVRDLRAERKLCVDGSSGAARLDELIKLASGKGEPDVEKDDSGQPIMVDKPPREKRPRKF